MNGFGWIPTEATPQTAAKAVPQAISQALKSQRLVAYPRTTMGISNAAQIAVINAAGAILQGWDVQYTTRQLSLEISSRGYEKTTRGQFGNGADVIPEGYMLSPTGSHIIPIPAAGALATFRASKAFPVVVGLGALGIAYLLVRAVGKASKGY